jgi:hypothetical protein
MSDARYIPLTRGKYATVDAKDFDKLQGFSWRAVQNGQRWYAARKDGWKGEDIYMHRQLLNAPAGIDVAHKDGDGLNNRRDNISLKSRSRNLRGVCKKRSGATSQFRGVSWSKKEGCWRAQIHLKDRNKFLGRHVMEEDAARAFNAAALEHFGEDAQLNIIE